MFKHRFHDPTTNFKTYLHWFMLAFMAGDLNTGGYIACHRFISHVTGFATLTGIEAASGNWLPATAYLIIPGFFLLGAFVAALLTESTPDQHTRRFTPVMLLIATLLLIIVLAGELGLFGFFGDSVSLESDFTLLALLCGACGLLNSTITIASGGTVRATHLTGVTTDLGIGLARAEILASPPDDKRRERLRNLIRFITILVFMVGSWVGANTYFKFGYLGFCIPAILALYGAWVASYESNKV